MKKSSHVSYDFITENKNFLKAENECTIDNLMGIYKPFIKKFTREKLLDLCYQSCGYDENRAPSRLDYGLEIDIDLNKWHP
jgi:hypothetical protein